MNDQVTDLILKRIDDVKDSTCQKIDSLHVDVRSYAAQTTTNTAAIKVCESRLNTHRNIFTLAWGAFLTSLGLTR